MSTALDYAIRDSSERTTRYLMLAKAAAPAGSMAGVLNSAASTFFGLGQSSMGNAAEQYRHFHGWVYSSIRPIAQRIAGQPIRVARRIKKDQRRRGKAYLHPKKAHLPTALKSYNTDLEILEDHPLTEAICDPNELMVRWVLAYVTICNLELTGRCYWWLRDVEGKLNIWPLPTHWVQPRHGGKFNASYAITPFGQGTTIEVPGDEIINFYYPSPSNPLGAVSPLQAQARAVVADEAITESQRRAFSNGIHPGVVLTVGRHPDLQATPGMLPSRPILTQEQRNQLITAIKQKYQGVVRYDEPIILDGLIENVTRITDKPREMDYLNSTELSKERIMQGFGTNPIVVGQVEGANRASSVTAEDHFLHNTINPKIDLLSECMTAWLGPRFARGNEELIVYIEKPEIYDAELSLQRLRLMAQVAAINRNEIRATEGLPPIVDGDQIVAPGYTGEMVTVTPEEEAGKRASRRGFWELPNEEPGRNGRSMAQAAR